jgi:hypothetical protein
MLPEPTLFDAALPVKVEMRPIPGHPDYFVTDDGRAYSKKPHARSGKMGVLHELALIPGGKNGAYRYICVTNRKRLGIHQAVAMAFLPPPMVVDGKMQWLVRHRDNNPSNNRADNLLWGTQEQNLADRYGHGTVPLGEVNAAAKLTAEQVLEIRRRRIAGERCRDIAPDFAVRSQEIHRIGLGERWGHIPGALARRQRRTRKESVSHFSPLPCQE